MAEKLRHLLVFIPGIGGSELVDPENGDTVWRSGIGSIVAAVTDPDRLQVDRPLRATGLLTGFTVVPLFKSIDGYDRTWATLTATFHNSRSDCGHPDRPHLDANIVAFPYDFRLGVAHAAEQLAATLAPRFERLGDATTVVLVGHSMGGLVARRWASHHDPDNRCRGIITLGTPFRGAPKALDVVVNGLYWGSKALQRRKLSDVVRQWPGVHDLAPIDDRVDDGSGTLRAAWELSDLPGAAALTSARTTHLETRCWWAEPEPRPALVTVTGYGHGTPSTLSWSGGRLRVSKKPLSGERDGDGTVPHFSTVPPEWSGAGATSRVRPCGDQHGAISHTPQLREYLVLLNSGDPPAVRGDSVSSSFLGFDVPEIVEPGDRLIGSLRRDDEPVSSSAFGEPSRVTARFKSATGEESELAVDCDDTGFAVDVPTGDGVVYLSARHDRASEKQPPRRAECSVVVLGADG